MRVFLPIFRIDSRIFITPLFTTLPFEVKFTLLPLNTTPFPIVIIPDKTETIIFGAVRAILSRSKSPSAVILIIESDLMKPPSKVRLPAQEKDAPSSNDEIKAPEQLAFRMLEEEIEAALAATGNNTK